MYRLANHETSHEKEQPSTRMHLERCSFHQEPERDILMYPTATRDNSFHRKRRQARERNGRSLKVF
jgi:hypothetical protein